MKKIVIFLILSFVSVLVSELLNSNAVASELQNDYEVTSVRDTLLTNDSIVVVHTVCAPICSSCVRVYNKDWYFLGMMTPPIRTAFPEAYIQDGKLLWRDNDPYDYNPAP